MHSSRSDEAEKVQVAQMVRISIEHRVKPTPRPKPIHIKPVVIATPQHVVVTRTPHPAPAAPKAKAGLAKSIAHTKYHKAVAHVPILVKHAQGAGLGAHGGGRGVTGTHGTGTGSGGAGHGTGSGGTGNGTGGYAASDEPCGFVEFTNINTPKYSNGAFYQDIRMTVHYGGGTTESYNLDYPFYYPSEASFPWSDQNIKNVDYPVNFQFPPASKRASEPPIVQYVMNHSTPDGVTTLKDCKGM